MKQIDIESSNYKFKEEIKSFITSFNENIDKYIKTFENCDSDLKKITNNIEKKNASIQRLDASLVDFNNRTDELRALKELSAADIKSLEAKKAEISYTDSEVQKMETDDLNSQISAKKGKISKIEAKLESTKAKIKTSTEEKKNQEKQLKDLEKEKRTEEEALFKTESLLNLIRDTKKSLNDNILAIVSAPYKPAINETEVIDNSSKTEKKTETAKSEKNNKKVKLEDMSVMDLVDSSISNFGVTEEDLSVIDFKDETPNLDAPIDFPTLDTNTKTKTEAKTEKKSENNPELEKIFKKESINIDDFSKKAKDKMSAKIDTVKANLEVLKKHNVPLEYTIDQSEIYYDIESQDLDDLLSIITTDDEGNGMGFTIDYTFNILSELSKINVDKLIDVYNEEFMNINSKSGIIGLLKLTNPSLNKFEKNRTTNIETLKSIGTITVDEIIKKYPEFIDMDTPLFLQVLNVFDKSDLVDKLNSDVDVIPKIMDYWKNN